MCSKSKTYIFIARKLVFLSLLIILFSLSSSAQDKSIPNNTLASQKELSLLRLESSISQLSAELREKQNELIEPKNEGTKEQISHTIQDLTKRLEALELNFIEIASGIDLEAIYRPKLSQSIDLGNEAKELLGPVLNEIKRITSRPREIDRLRNEIALQQDNLELIQQAKNNITKLRQNIKDQRLIDRIDVLSSEWENKKQNVLTLISTTRQRLEQKEEERISIAESLGQIIQIFFKSRGRNLAFAFGIATVFWFVFSWICALFFAKFKYAKEKTFSYRLLNILSYITASIGTIIVFLMVLYFFGDWVLLILGLLLALGVLWASKQAIPKFGSQVTMMLNMGAVREGERVIFDGIPWLVNSINFYSELYNPELQGGRLRLPLHKLVDLHSRKFERNEPWFPTHEGEWIIINDVLFGKIIQQTVESVKVLLLGGLIKIYKTSEFASLNTTILSRGFRITVIFGLDYSHQSLITEEIPEKMRAFIDDGLDNCGYRDALKFLKVQFQEAKASSLNLQIEADFTGEAAEQYDELKHLINKFCVEACSKYNWIIPFNKLSIDFAGKVPEKFK